MLTDDDFLAAVDRLRTMAEAPPSIPTIYAGEAALEAFLRVNHVEVSDPLSLTTVFGYRLMHLPEPGRFFIAEE